MRRVSSLWSRAPTARHPFFVPLFLPASLSLASTRPSATFSSTAAQHNKHNTANNKHADPPTDSAHSFKTRLDYRYIRDNAEAIAQNIKDRSTGGDPYKVAALYEQKAASETELKHTQHLRKKNAKSMKGKLSKEERTTLIEQGKQLKETIAGQQEELNRLVYDLEREGLLIPNETHPDSPIGCEEKAELVGVYNAHINATGEGERDFPLLDHMTLGRKHKLFCLERGAISSGSNFYYLTNEGAMLEMALINYSFQKLVSKGFTPIIPPDLVRPSVSQGCGFTPRQGDSSSQLYSIEGQDLCLAATAEIPMAGYFADRILDEKELPQKVRLRVRTGV